MLCFNKYIQSLLLFFLLSLYPLSLHAERSVTVPAGSESPAVLPQRALASFAPASRLTSRVLSEDTLWSGAVQVDGMITVAAQATLTIMPGTIVRFASDSGILVLGRIVARGSAELPIVLASQYGESLPADWYGIVLTGTTKKNIFDQVRMQGADAAIQARSSAVELKNMLIEKSSVAIRLADSTANLTGLGITDCLSGLSAVKSEIDLESVVIARGETALSVISSSLSATKLKISSSALSAFVAEKSQLKIEKSVFSDNLTGAMVIGCEGSFTTSKFLMNADTAVTLSGSLLRFSSNFVSGNKIGIQLVDALPAVWGNSIYANSSYNLLYLGEDRLYAGGNWFGTVNFDLAGKSLFSKRKGAIQMLPLLAADPVRDQLKDL